jgi:hypothetical protein
MYKDVANNTGLFQIKSPDAFLPKPSDQDYSNGFIRRYFIRKSNDLNAFIYEVSKDTIVKYEKISFWKSTSIKWKLVGTKEEVTESNRKAIAFVSKEFPTLALYIPNLTQFYRTKD